MDTVPSTPRIMPTRRNTVLPLIEAPLPTNNPDPSFTPPYLIRFSGHHEAISPKYDLIELSDSFCLHGEVPGVEDDIEIEFTDPQTMTIRGRSERSYASHIPPMGLIQGTMTRSTITKDSKISNLHETAVEDRRATPQPPQSQEKYLLSERSVGEFSRAFKFHVYIDQDRVQASIKNGLLSIIIPKAEKVTIS
jgi:HSP20 family protein